MRGRAAAPKRGRRGRFAFVQDIIAELRKVTWPTRREAIRLTILVLIISAAVGLFLGAVDFAFTEFARLILPGVR